MEGDREREAFEAEHRGWTTGPGGLMLPPERGSDFGERIQEWATRIGTAAASLAGLVIVVHLLGGVVMWLRFRKADLPADQALAFMTREQMLTIGLRLIVLPALTTCALAVFLVWAERRRVERGRPARGGHALVAVIAVIVVALLLSLPMSWASLTWIGLALVIVYWWRGFGVTARPADEPTSYVRLAAVAVLAAAVSSLGRQIDDEPVQLLRVDVMLEGATKRATGVFVGVDSSAVYVGNTTTRTIDGYRRADVRSIVPEAVRGALRGLPARADAGDLQPCAGRTGAAAPRRVPPRRPRRDAVRHPAGAAA